MSDSLYQELLDQVFGPEPTPLLTQITPLYSDLEKALQEARPGRKSQEEVSFRFERLRLSLGITLLQLLTDLGGDEESLQIRDLLQEALTAASVKEIDAIIQKQSHLFEELYTDLYVNADAEHILALFEETLNASSKEETDDLIDRALSIAEDLEFQDDEEEDEPEA
ncbi:hypothetical protein ACD591_03050 [Rufibacter glacialis]|uniref:Uncharacterized protein n=1 Tax=Rufibacter glacialis TaxID=1259555 RepID=A0A5M8QM82_9BACT|nr:hypothetical protein [Rufibacter glacialis]KAA6435856.1 hypothetical protein FOE74_07950 [Rufibacter glacialis]GGK67145.1 hypothetical protein GCM10011405_13900 [Rufibacter glacialis]